MPRFLRVDHTIKCPECGRYVDEVITESNPIEISTIGPIPDPDWRYVDMAGHVHRYDNEAKMRRYYVDLTCDDGYDIGHNECIHCGEWIVPGTKPSPPYRQYIAGPMTTRLKPCGHLVPPEQLGVMFNV